MTPRSLLVTLLLICILGVGKMYASNDTKSCFSITVRKDNTDQKSPSILTLLDSSGKIELTQERGGYCIPEEWRNRKLLDVSFVVGKDRLYLTRIHVENLRGTLLISYGKAETARLGL